MKIYAGFFNLSFLVFLLVCFPTVAAAQYSGGNGTELDPYIIASKNDLFNIGQNPEHWDRYFLQTENIVMGSFNDSSPENMYTPPGINFFNPFTGAYNGNGFEIQDLSIDQNQSDLGLFGYLLYPAQLLNINLVNVNIKGDSCVGALAGISEANVINCTVGGIVAGTYNVGGMIGCNGGRIYDCHTSGSVAGSDTVGGICGVNAFYFYDLQIVCCGLLDSSYSTSAVNATKYAGGICGENPDYISKIHNCYALGTVSADYAVGGLCAFNNAGAEISGCYSDNAVTGGSYAAGLVAMNLGASISNCYTSGCVTGTSYIGGLCAYNDGEYLPTYNDYCWGWIDCSFSDCNISVTGNNNVIGGLCAQNNTGIICCFACNEIITYGQNNTIGGLIGSNEYCVNSYSYGKIDIYGDYNSGGGFVCYTDGHIGDSYERGKINDYGDSNTIGPFYAVNSNVIENCFWDVEVMNIDDPEAGGVDTDGVEGITTSQMMDINTFLDAGWDFVGRTQNGIEDYWEMGIFPVTYCQNYIDIMDFSILAQCWYKDNCGLTSDCHFVDLLVDQIVDINDLAILTAYWLSYEPVIRAH